MVAEVLPSRASCPAALAQRAVHERHGAGAVPPFGAACLPVPVTGVRPPDPPGEEVPVEVVRAARGEVVGGAGADAKIERDVPRGLLAEVRAADAGPAAGLPPKISALVPAGHRLRVGVRPAPGVGLSGPAAGEVVAGGAGLAVAVRAVAVEGAAAPGAYISVSL